MSASTMAASGASAGISAGIGVNNAASVTNAANDAGAAGSANALYDEAIANFQAAELNVMVKNIEFQTIQAGWAPVQKVAGANASS